MDGDVVVSGQGDYRPLVGGLAGYHHMGSAGDCWVNGDVIVDYQGPQDGDIGLLVGNQYTKGSFWHYNCGVVKSASDPDFSSKIGGVMDAAPAIGYGSSAEKVLDTFQYKYGGMGERPVTVQIYGGILGGESGFPLAGAKVTVGDYVGYTDGNGTLVLNCGQEVFRSAVTVTVEREGYPPLQTTHLFATNMGVFSTTLWRLNPGEIFITGGSVRLTETAARDIFSKSKIRFTEEDDTFYWVNVKVNWNGHTPDRVYLVGEESGETVGLAVSPYGGSGYVKFSSSFQPQEAIQVVAVTKEDPEYGVLEKKLTTSLMVQPLKVHIVVQESGDGTGVSSGEKESSFFLEDLKIKLDLSDLANCASSMTLQNGVLTVTFTEKESTKSQGNLFHNITTTVKDEVSVSGTITFPMADPAFGTWKGNIAVGLNQSTTHVGNKESVKKQQEIDAKKGVVHTHTFDFVVMGFPCYVETSLGVKGGASLEFGPYGSVDGTTTFTIDIDDVSLGPVIKGEIGGEATFHAFIVDISKKLTIGGFRWDKNGLKWLGDDDGEGGSGGGGSWGNVLSSQTAVEEDWVLRERAS